MTPAEALVRAAELEARAALGRHDPEAFVLVRAALARRAMTRSNLDRIKALLSDSAEPNHLSEEGRN